MVNRGTGALMSTGIILAAVIVVVRIVLEQLGAPEMVNNIFGVAWLYFVFPVLFALRIIKSGVAGPYRALFMNLMLFAIYTRLIVAVTYVAAYLLQWQAPRFSLSMGGNVGAGVSPMQGTVVIPLRNALVWIVFIVIIGMIIGGPTIFLKRKKAVSAAS